MTIPQLAMRHNPHLLLSENPSSSENDTLGESIEEWKEALNNYELALRTIHRSGSQNRDVLLRLDKIIYIHLPIIISSRNPHYITASEYVIIVEWKLRRGRWRPQNLPFARMTTDDVVITASKKAFKALEQGKIGVAFDALLPLLGSSPTVASAILSVRDTSVPVMSIELLRATLGNNINFFRSTFLEMVENVKAKARYLSRRDVTRTWTSVDVEKAVYAQARISHATMQNPEPDPGPELPIIDITVPPRNIEEQHMESGGPIGAQGLLSESVHGRTETAGQASRFSRRKKRISVRQRPLPVVDDEIEVLTGDVDLDDGEEIDDVADESGGSLYIPRSDPTDIDEGSDDEGMDIARSGSLNPLGERSYHRYR